MEIERPRARNRARISKKEILIIIGIILIIIIVGLIVYFVTSSSPVTPGPNHGSGPGPGPSKLPPVKTQSKKSQLALSYLSSVYPMVKNDLWKALSDERVNDVYQSLCWYYTPLPLDVGQQSVILPMIGDKANTKQVRSTFSRRAPLVGAYYNISTEAFLTDGQDQVQILSPVHEGGPPQFNPDQSCSGSQIGFAGTMPQNQHYMPILENSATLRDFKTLGAGVGIGDWWPAYVDPDPNNPDAKLGAGDGVCGYSDICLNAQSAGAPSIHDSNNKNMGASYCFGGAVGAFSSAFPSAPMGPLWNMGMKPCDPSDLDFDGSVSSNTTKQPAIASRCVANIYGLDPGPTGGVLGGTSAGMLAQSKKANRTSDKFQMVNLIQPYGRKQGCGNFGFIEGVAYVMEGLGRQLLSAPDCTTGMSPDSIAAFGRTAWCVTRKNGTKSQLFDRNTGKMNSVDMVTCNPTDFSGCASSVKQWKESGSIEYYENPYMPSACSDCCFSTSVNTIGASSPIIPGSTSQDLNKDSRDGFNLAVDPSSNSCIQNPGIGSDCTGGKIMFYWLNGYGKFLNMGLTGVYSSYIGFLMSCPNQPWNAINPTKGPFLRRTIPQIDAIGLGGGAKNQLNMFTNGSFKDNREFLSGYVSTFQVGAPVTKKAAHATKLYANNFSTILKKAVPFKYDFEATPEDYEKCVIIVTGRMLFAKKWGPHLLPNKKNASVWKDGTIDKTTLQKAQTNTWYASKYKSMNLPESMQNPPGLGNCQGLLNPQEGISNFVTNGSAGSAGDNFLCQIAAYTVQCYYPPNLGIKNLAYKSYMNVTPDFGAIFWGGMYIMGDTGADWYGYNEGGATCAQVSEPKKCPSWPFGTYYFAANIGSCVYGLTAALGWNSSQFSVMSTGGGGAKACDYPNYDYEIVYVGGSGLKNRVCQNSVPITDAKGKTVYNDDVYGFKLLDFSGGNQLSLVDYYSKSNYVQGSSVGMTDTRSDLITCLDTGSGPVWASTARMQAFKDMFSQFSKRYKLDYQVYKQTPFDTCLMPLSEMNVYTDTWKDNRPNSLFYKEPDGECSIIEGERVEERSEKLKKYLECENKGGVGKTWPFGIETSGASDCPYKDGNYGMRQQALKNNVNQLWTTVVNKNLFEEDSSLDSNSMHINRRKWERRDN